MKFSSHLDDFEGAILDAHDPTIYLPSDRNKVSPALRQTFDQSWQRWKSREAEEAALVEMDKLQLEQEQIKLFGGNVGDDVSLCEPMLRVLSYLFGDIDYTDP